jgi:tetratricopeptide (TPR) repeat protein
MQFDVVLGQLNSAQLIRRTAEENLTFSFCHTLTQEVVYGSLLRNDRKQLHRLVGEVLVQAYPKDLASLELAPVLAQHFDAAGDDRAFEYWILAGDASAHVYANAEAIMQYTRALEIGKRGRMSLQDVYLKRGRSLELSGKHDAALDNYIEMASLAHERSDRGMELASLIARATIRSTLSAGFDTVQAQALSDQALTLARELGDRPSEAKILWNLMLLNLSKGTSEGTLEYGERSLAIARELGLHEQVAFTLNDISRAYGSVGQIEQARSALDEAREMWRSFGNLPMLADNLTTSAYLEFYKCNYAKTLKLAEEARQISASIGNLWGQSYSNGVYSFSCMQLGLVDQAIQAAEQSVQLGDQVGFLDARYFVRSMLAFIYGSMGDPERGMEIARISIDVAREYGSAYSALPQAILAQLYLMHGDIDQGRAYLEQSRAGFESHMIDSPAPILILLADGYFTLAERNYDRTIATMDQLDHMMRGIGSMPFTSEMLLLKSRALKAKGRTDEARALLEQARVAGEDVRRTLWEVLADLSQVEKERGNLDQAQALRTQARAVVEFVAEHTPADLREKFLKLPNVHAVVET